MRGGAVIALAGGARLELQLPFHPVLVEEPGEHALAVGTPTLLEEQVALGDDADDGAVLADDRDARDAALDEQPGHLPERRRRADRDDIG